jgi:osmoprotectant transport system substrate-binding protein
MTGITRVPSPPASFRRFAAGGLAAAVGLTLAACGSSGGKSGGNPLSQGAAKGTVVIGSANFPEDELLATIYAQALQAKGVKVTTKLNIGSREVYYPEIKKGSISIIPEYNGALLTGPVDPSSTAASTAQVDAELKAKLPSTLEILNPSSAVDSDSVTVTQATARRYHLTSISNITPSMAKHWVFGGPPEFKTRSDGIPGLKKRYGLDFKFKQTDESSTVTFTDLKNGTVQAADVFTTAPQIVTDHFVALADPKHDFAAQNVLPLVYRSAMTPKITSTLNAISAALTTNALLQMDTALDVQHASYSQVAAGFLKAVHLG